MREYRGVRRPPGIARRHHAFHDPVTEPAARLPQKGGRIVLRGPSARRASLRNGHDEPAAEPVTAPVVVRLAVCLGRPCGRCSVPGHAADSRRRGARGRAARYATMARDSLPPPVGQRVGQGQRRWPRGCGVGHDLPVGRGLRPRGLRVPAEVFVEVPEDFELVVQMDTLQAAQEALPSWTVAQAVVHSLVRPYPSGERAEAGVVVSAPPEQRWLEGLPEDVRLYARLAEAIAVQIVGGAVVAVCAAGDVTETLWDVGIDTLEGHRRRGHAAACFHALAAWMAGRGRQPVWSAYEDYPPSLTLAAKLGFQPVDRIAVLSPTSQATS